MTGIADLTLVFVASKEPSVFIDLCVCWYVSIKARAP